MGKLILISGPNGSGKSRYAESLFASAPPERYYIATMVPQTEENITEAVWMDRARLEEALKDTFPSILEVFAKVL